MLTLPILLCYINYLFGYLCATVVIALFILEKIKWTHKIGLILLCIIITFLSTLFIDLYHIKHYQMKENIFNFFNKQLYLEKGNRQHQYIEIKNYRIKEEQLQLLINKSIYIKDIIYLGRVYQYYFFCLKDENKKYAISYSFGDILILPKKCDDYNLFIWFNKIDF